ncbi:MAG: pilus assembly protein [Chloroflexi bacterium]|nr:pilus assembly protein [Chloroflexota bacterium]
MNRSKQRGSVLVQTALMMTVLLAFVALAVDLGQVYAVRRRLQNAADAGALAGARALCFGAPAQAFSQASTYASLNGAPTATISIDYDQERVHVVAQETVSTYFAGVIGLSSFDVQAEATAACGVTNRVCGAFPVAFDLPTWEAKIACDQEFYVWDDDSIEDDMCDKCECEGVIGSAASIGPGHRGWVRMPYPPPLYPNPGGCTGNCGADDLKCWILNDYHGPLQIGQCVPGNPGVDASTQKEAEKREGDIVTVILWDAGACGPENTLGDCPGDLYYIAGFGRVELIDIDTKLTIPPKPGFDQSDCPKNAKAMRVRKVCDSLLVGCGHTDGVPVEEGFRSVSLVD